MPRASSRLGLWLRAHPWRAGVLLVLLVLVGGTVVDLLRVRAEVNAGRSSLTDLKVEQLDRDVVRTVGRATGHLERADRIADRSPFLSIVGVAPVARAQIDGLRTLTEAAADLGQSARRAAEAIAVDLDDAGSEPAARLRLLATLATELDRIEADAGAIDLGEGQPLPGPLGSARDELRAELDRLPERFGEARTRVRALERVLQGPTRYLVLAGNNAEMRGGAGMPLSGGLLTIQDGDLDFGDFEPIANQFAGPIDPSLVPAHYRRTYVQFRMGRSWLQTAVSPNFTTVGPIYDAMSSAFPDFGPVDGVIEVDAVTLRHLLAAIGPVKVEGVQYTAENVERQILNENYLRFKVGDERAERHEAQGEIAAGIFDALKTRDVGIARLSDALRTAAAGRHLLAFAEDDDVQEMFVDLGASGALRPDGLMVTVQNIAADKLDWYIDPSTTIRAVPTGGEDAWNVRLTVHVPNPEREGHHPGVESFKDGYEDGVHRALVAIYLPAQAFDIRSLDLGFSESGLDAPMWMVGKRIFIDEGDTKSVAIEFKLPREPGGVVVLPSGRVRPMRVTVNGAVTNDAVTRPVGFGTPPDAGRSAGAPDLAALFALLGVVALVLGHRRQLAPSPARPLVAPSPWEARLPSLGLLLLLAAGGTLIAGALIDGVV